MFPDISLRSIKTGSELCSRSLLYFSRDWEGIGRMKQLTTKVVTSIASCREWSFVGVDGIDYGVLFGLRVERVWKDLA